MKQMIFNVSTGNPVSVCFRQLSILDVSRFGLNISNGWFQWEDEMQNEENKVFGLFTEGNNGNIQGVVALQEWPESQMIHISLMEAAPHNRFNHSEQKYAGVGKNLLCFAMHYSLSIPKFEGYVGLMAKKNINEKYYQDCGAIMSNEIEGKPYYYFRKSVSRSLTEKYLPGGVTICPN